MKVVVIIPAAGLGTRMVGAPPAGRSAGVGKLPTPSKQFSELNGVPILIHTLRKFTVAPQIQEIYVALRKQETESFQSRLEKDAPDVLKKRLRFVEGGEHRQQSVANAIAQVEAAPEDIVLVHDAVRPFVDQEVIENVIQAATRYGAAIAGLPAVDTVKQVDRTAEGAIIVSTIPRERVVLAQTPQGFSFEVLKKAFDEAAADGFMGTDEASLVERSGHDVAVVMGSARNIKITTPADLELAEFYLQQQSRQRAAG